MAYYEDIDKRLDLQQGFLCNNLVQLINSKYCIINGHRGISIFSKEMIRVKVKVGNIIIEGKDLQIILLTPNELYVMGMIKGICLDE